MRKALYLNRLKHGREPITKPRRTYAVIIQPRPLGINWKAGLRMNDNTSYFIEELIKMLDECNFENEYEFVKRFTERIKEAGRFDEGADDVE